MNYQNYAYGLFDNIEDMNRLLSSIKDYIETLCEEEK